MEFVISEAYGQGWNTISKGERRKMGMKFKEEVTHGKLPSVQHIELIQDIYQQYQEHYY